MPSAASPSGHPSLDPATTQQLADAFRLGAVTRVQTVLAGLMNRNWRVSTDRGVWAVKEILDVTVEQARRQHRAAAALADRGLPYRHRFSPATTRPRPSTTPCSRYCRGSTACTFAGWT
jgi:hypothetical protein